MLVFWDQRLAFLATPKTGSTALAAALEPYAAWSIQRPPLLKHTTAQRYHRFIGPYLRAASGEDFMTVALMREPLDWLGSWYRFRQRPDLADPRHSTKDKSFDEFVESYCAKPQPGFANVGSQARFLTPPGKPPVDRIFRYEAMGDFVAFLEDRLKVKLQLDRLNVSPPAEVKISAQNLRQLESSMSADFELYEKLA